MVPKYHGTQVPRSDLCNLAHRVGMLVLLALQLPGFGKFPKEVAPEPMLPGRMTYSGTTTPQGHSDDGTRLACVMVEGRPLAPYGSGALQSAAVADQNECATWCDSLLGADVQGCEYDIASSTCFLVKGPVIGQPDFTGYWPGWACWTTPVEASPPVTPKQVWLGWSPSGQRRRRETGLKECEGDCDSNSDCHHSCGSWRRRCLYCQERSGSSYLPKGCSAGTSPSSSAGDADYCVHSEEGPFTGRRLDDTEDDESL